MTSVPSWVKRVCRSVGDRVQNTRARGIDGNTQSRFPCSRIYCNDKLLRTFQLARWNTDPDSKMFVDRPLRFDAEKVLKRFKKLERNASEAKLKRFLLENFYPSPEDDDQIIPCIPGDFSEFPPRFLLMYPSEHPGREFAMFIKSQWKKLCRIFQSANDRLGNLQTFDTNPRSSLIPLPYPFIIPGGRFREVYYWDTLWIVHGLLACDMTLSAINAVRNLLYLVKELGFVPNGNRVYYLNRSHPPVLSECVWIVFEHLPAESVKLMWILEALPTIEQEYLGYIECRTIRSPTNSDKFGPLAAYRVKTDRPRPESYREDVNAAKKAKQRDYKIRRAQVYQDLASAAESGWDFSSRWLDDVLLGISSIRTSKVIPVCLNAVLLRTERILSDLYGYLERKTPMFSDTSANKYRERSIKYAKAAENRSKAIMSNLWSDRHGIWMDLDIESNLHSEIVSAAAVMAVWAEAWRGHWQETDATLFVDTLMNRSGLIRFGGMVATSENSEEQWDYPNMWPPLSELAISGLRKLHREFPACGAGKAAEEIAMRTLRSIYRGWRSSGEMHEKYDATDDGGRHGFGGEYAPQIGFGWTNGVALKLLKDYSKEICEASPGQWLSDEEIK